jgi:uncharacterized membrane protein
VIAGYNQDQNDNRTAWRWTAAGGYQDIAPPPAGAESQVTALSADGKTAVGEFNTGNQYTPFVWTSANGIANLPTTSGASPIVSADGSTIAGETRTSSGYIWTAASGVTPINALPGSLNIHPVIISANGSQILGDATNNNQSFLFEYAGGVMSTTPSPSFGNYNFASTGLSGATSDFSQRVGMYAAIDPSTNNIVSVPWFWSAKTGYETIQDYLAASGINTGAYDIDTIAGISPDGMVLYGHGLDDGIQPSTWVAVVPEPSMLFMGVVAIAMIGRRHQHRQSA